MAGKRDDIDLMQYHDGELPPEQAAEVAAQLEASEEDRNKVQALGEIGESVRTYLEVSADEAEPALEGAWAQVERRIRANGESEGVAQADGTEAADVSSRVPARVAEEQGGIVAAIRRWLDARRGYIVTSAVTAGAVAALILVFRPPTERVVERTVQGPARTVEAKPAALESTPATVEYLDVVDGTGTVLTIPGEGDEGATTVIWVEGPI